MQRVIGLAMAISLALMVGIVSATAGDMIFSEQINRPGNFAYSDNAIMTGWNEWSHSSDASAGAFTSDSMFSTLAVPDCAAPEEKSHENVQMTFVKDGQTVDPLIGETIDSDITVGAVNNRLPTFDSHGQLTSDANDRYDVLKYTLGGSAGSDGSRDVNSQIMSSQDDFIRAIGYDSAGNVNPVMTSWTEATIPGTPGTDESQAYREFNWQDSRGWKPVVGDVNGAWDISNLIQYQVYQIPFNFGK